MCVHSKGPVLLIAYPNSKPDQKKQFLPDQLTLSKPGGGAHYAHHITFCHPGFFDLAMALKLVNQFEKKHPLHN